MAATRLGVAPAARLFSVLFIEDVRPLVLREELPVLFGLLFAALVMDAPPLWPAKTRETPAACGRPGRGGCSGSFLPVGFPRRSWPAEENRKPGRSRSRPFHAALR